MKKSTGEQSSPSHLWIIGKGQGWKLFEMVIKKFTFSHVTAKQQFFNLRNSFMEIKGHLRLSYGIFILYVVLNIYKNLLYHYSW